MSRARLVKIWGSYCPHGESRDEAGNKHTPQGTKIWDRDSKLFHGEQLYVLIILHTPTHTKVMAGTFILLTQHQETGLSHLGHSQSLEGALGAWDPPRGSWVGDFALEHCDITNAPEQSVRTREDPTPFKRQYLVVFVYVCFTLLLTSYCRIYASQCEALGD